MRRLSARRATAVLRSDVEDFERLGYRPHEGGPTYAVTLSAPQDGLDLVLRLAPEGRIFGGNWGLEVSTAEPVLPATAGGLAARGRGVVRMQGVRFRPRSRRDEPAARWRPTSAPMPSSPRRSRASTSSGSRWSPTGGR